MIYSHWFSFFFRMTKVQFYIYFLNFLIICIYSIQGQLAEKLTFQNPCTPKTTCHECIQTPSCAWCFMLVRILFKKGHSIQTCVQNESNRKKLPSINVNTYFYDIIDKWIGNHCFEYLRPAVSNLSNAANIRCNAIFIH